MLADQDLEVALLAIDAERARRSLATFIREGAWSIVEPETPLVWNWLLDALCQHLEAVAAGRIRYRETIAQGLVAAPRAFLGMLRGENFGKQLVRVSAAASQAGKTPVER